jgi:hypothetical protein
VLETIAYGRLIAHPTAVPIGIPEHHDVMQAALQEAEEVPASAGPAAGGV